MCGRYTLTVAPDAIRDEFGVEADAGEFSPRYNIAPQTPVPVIGLSRDGEPRLGMLRWGLVPWWARDAAVGQRMINARAETLAGKPAFREAFERRRCLIPADGFYEWRREDGRRIPMRICLPDGRPFAFAGVWEKWRDPAGGEPLHTCAIVTTAANDAVRPIHDRMPVILGPDERAAWLDPQGDPEALLRLLKPYDGELRAYEVSTVVNAAANDVARCIEPVPPAALPLSLQLDAAPGSPR
jgi:putative SOS response-associated peptidase YedK